MSKINNSDKKESIEVRKNYLTKIVNKLKYLISKLGYVKLAASVVAVILLSLFLVNYIQTKDKLNTLQSNTVVASSKDEEMVSKIRTYFDLPNEAPLVQTVGDTDKLSKDDFFNRAKTGDKVLIFTQAKRALLFRPSNGKIIEYSIVN